MNINRYMTLSCLAIAAALIVSCAPTRLELDYGTSHRLVKMNQVLHPEAGQADRPVTGVDGEAAKNSLDQYRQSFSKSQAKTGSVIETLK
jgi:hypothetical protein